MKKEIEAHEMQLERLLTEAALVASGHHSREFGSEHLLFVISGTEEGRRVIDGMGGRPGKIRKFLESTFEYNKRTTPEIRTTPRIGETINMVIHDPVTKSRLSNEPITLRAILLQMIALGDFCHTTREALRSGGLVEKSLESGEEGQRENGDKGEGASGAFADDETPFPPNINFENPYADDEPELGPNGEMPAEPTPEGEADAQKHAKPAEPQQVDEHHKAVVAAIRNLSSEAVRGKLDEVIGRDDVIGRVIDTLCRRTKRNVVLSGDPGVGKTAIAEGLAQALSGESTPAQLKGRPVLEVSLSEIVAGTRFRGDFEARMSRLMEIARAQKAILFIDEIHTIVGAGAVGGSKAMDAVNILKPALARGEISIVGATTPGEMRAFRQDGALMRRFRIEQVREPSAAETRIIVDRAVSSYLMHHEVNIEPDVLDEVVSLADRYLKQSRFPDKAFDLIDTACVIATRKGESMVAIDHLREAIPMLGGPRLGRPDAERAERVRKLEETLNARVFGQPKAAAELARAARISLLGLQPGGTAGSYLFNGPTGVGKTEMSEAFASALGLPLVQISMSEFTEKHSVARLIGAPPGYVGYDEEGLLVAAGDCYPEFVLLLDEIEKAHPDVFDILLQVLDKGVVRAADGRCVPMAGAHVIMTANIGAQEAEKQSIGFGRATDEEEVTTSAIKRMFRKEFLARVQKQVQFDHIDEGVLCDIARSELARVSSRLHDAAIEVEIAEQIAAFLASAAASEPYAARSLQLRIKEDVSDRVADVVLEAGGADRVSIKLKKGKIAVDAY